MKLDVRHFNYLTCQITYKLLFNLVIKYSSMIKLSPPPDVAK